MNPTHSDPSSESIEPLEALEPAWRRRLALWVEGRIAERVILTLILINAITLGLETSATVMATAGAFIGVLDKAILTVFVVEIAARIVVHRLAFFRDPWSLFDFTVVAIALTPATGQFSVLRALRVLRVLRVFSMVPQMRRVVGALLTAIPGLYAIALVLLLLYYVFAVIATNLFGQHFPDWFGDIGLAMYTLFQVMTLESWSMGIVRPVMEQFPYAWAFFIPFILIATFTMLNLFIAIIVNAMQTYTEAEHRETVAEIEHVKDDLGAQVHAEVLALREEMRALRGEIAARLPERGQG